jgi:cytidylate kinase
MAVVTVSRGAGSKGQAFAQELANRLGYELVSREDVVQEAAKYGVPAERLQKALLEAPGFWDRLTLDRKRYLAFVQEALAERVRKDRIVYEGNAGHLLLRGISHVVCIRLLAPLSQRVQTAMRSLGMNEAEALRYIEDSDRERENWTRFLYGVDWLDPSLYDVTLNLRTLLLEGAVETALAVVQRPEFTPTEDSRLAMENLLLESRVRAALAADAETASAAVQVLANRGVVSLRGRVRPNRMVDSVVGVARRVEGVVQIDQRDLDAPEYTV